MISREMNRRMLASLLRLLILLVAAPLGTWACEPADPTGDLGLLKIQAGSFTFASLASVMAHVIKDKGFDRKHNLDLQVVPYGSVAAYYAGLASGEVDTIAGGPLIFQKMRLQGVPIVITNTYATMSSLVVISTSPNTQSLADLKGMRLAADMGSSEYQILRLLAERQGILLGTQIEVLQAGPAVARAHLQSGEADAILTFEPTASLVLREVPGARIVAQAQQGLQDIGMTSGWLLVSMMREDWIAQHPEGPQRWRAALADAAQFVTEQPVEADQIFAQAMNFPGGILLTALREDRVELIIRTALQEKESLSLLFNIAQESGFAAGIPGADAFYRTQ